MSSKLRFITPLIVLLAFTVPILGATTAEASSLTSPASYCPYSMTNYLPPVEGYWNDNFGDDFMADSTQGIQNGLLHGWDTWGPKTWTYNSWQKSTDGSIVNGYGYELPATWDPNANNGIGQIDAGGIGEPEADEQTYGLYMWCESVSLGGLSQGNDYNDMNALTWPSDNNWPNEGEIDAIEYTPYYEDNSGVHAATYVHCCSTNKYVPGNDPTFELQFTQPDWAVFAMEWQPSGVIVWECYDVSSGKCQDWQQLASISSSKITIPSTSMQFDFEAQDTTSYPGGSSPGTDDVLAIAWFEQYNQQTCCSG